MPFQRQILIFLVFGLALSLAAPPVCLAGIGMDSSEATLVDTANPEINLDTLPQNLRVIAGEQYDFHWTSQDQNPGPSEDDFTAVILVDQQPIETITWFPDIEEFTWNWVSPEVQSATCQVEVTVKDLLGNTTVATSDFFTVLYSTTGVEVLPTAVNFQSPYPNPFNPSCEMAFSLPAAENVELGVFDARGRKVRSLIHGTMPAGTTSIRWDGTDHSGRPQSGGVYFFVLRTEGPDGAIKMVHKATLIP